MWVFFAFGSALFAGLTSILAKIGIEGVDSHLATALRTVVVLVFSWWMVWISGSFGTITAISGRTLLFLILSGLATGASWICYFRALQIGDVNKVVPVDKFSTVLTMVLAFVFLGEPIGGWKLVAILFIGAGTYLMIQKQQTTVPEKQEGHGWFLFAALSAVFASLTAILGKIGIEGVESNLGTAIRTVVVLVMAWGIVFAGGKQRRIGEINGKSWLFIGLSGLATGLSWMCYYRALQEGPASVVVPIDKLSVVVTVLFAGVVFREKLSVRGGLGLLSLVAGTMLLLI